MQVEIKIPEHVIVTADDKGVTIERKGLRNLVDRGHVGSDTIPYYAINQVKFKKSVLIGGHLEIVPVSGDPHNWGYGGLDPTTAFTAYGKRFSVVFRQGKNREMENLRDYIIEKIKKAEKPKIHASSVDPAEEIAKFKKLLDENVITQEEFEEKKKQLLNL